MDWGQPHIMEPVSATCHSLSSCCSTSFPLTQALDHGNKFLSWSLPGLPAAQLSLHTSCIPTAHWAWAKPCPGGRQGHLGRLSGSHSSRTWKEWLDWQLQTLTDNLQWRMATIHQHKPNVASYHNYLEMSGSQESSQQKGGGKGRFHNERENTRWGNRKGKQNPIAVCFFSSVMTVISSF